jgi:predicted transposase YbfD/YdcC
MAIEVKIDSLLEHVNDLEDPRSTTNQKHPLVNVVVITICASIAGATKYTQVETFGKERRDWLETFLDLANGIPSHDTIGRIFRLMNPESFTKLFHGWIEAVFGKVGPQVIAIDGKTARRSGDSHTGIGPLHMVSAWAADDNISLGQVKTADKSNEITAIPLLLKQLDISECTITIDAMGCQKKIAEAIIEQQGDYVLGLKANQSELLEDAKALFEEVESAGGGFDDVREARCKTKNKGHGRVETREVTVMEDLSLPARQKEWVGLRTFARVVSTRTLKGKTSKETRYYASSLPCRAKRMAMAIRQHWSIENSLHWCLDIAFREDESVTRKGHGPENLAILKRLTHSLLKNETTHKQGIEGKRFRAAISPEYMLKVLCAPRS